jgi:hypothetical protein
MELHNNLEAQNNYMGPQLMREMGFTRGELEGIAAEGQESESRLREIGRELGWPKGRLLPSVAFLARKVRRESDYNFLYQGTSRFVHFSVVELMRRTWGKPGTVKVGSEGFSLYWEKFALSWGFFIFKELLVGCKDFMPSLELPDDKAAETLALLRNIGKIPIIMHSEMFLSFEQTKA